MNDFKRRREEQQRKLIERREKLKKERQEKRTKAEVNITEKCKEEKINNDLEKLNEAVKESNIIKEEVENIEEEPQEDEKVELRKPEIVYECGSCGDCWTDQDEAVACCDDEDTTEYYRCPYCEENYNTLQATKKCIKSCNEDKKDFYDTPDNFSEGRRRRRGNPGEGLLKGIFFLPLLYIMYTVFNSVETEVLTQVNSTSTTDAVMLTQAFDLITPIFIIAFIGAIAMTVFNLFRIISD